MIARVSVIIPTKDRGALLRDAIASVRAIQGPDLDLEIIVADNGDDAQAQSVAREFGARFVRVSKPGPAAARNSGISTSTGDYIAFLDDDDVWTSQHLRPHIKLLRDCPELSAVIGQIVPTTEERRPFAQPYPQSMPKSGCYFRPFLSQWPQVGALVVRSDAVAAVGPFDEGLQAAEDWDWFLRLALRHRMGFVNVPSVFFRVRLPGADEDVINRIRIFYMRKVFQMNLRRAGKSRPPIHVLARVYLKHNGSFAGFFLNSAIQQALEHKRSGARAAVIDAVRVSPLHVCWAVMRNASVRRMLRFVIIPGK